MPLRSRRAKKLRPPSTPAEALVQSARRGDVGGLRAALDGGATNLAEALARAIRSNRPLAVGYLIDRGADPNGRVRREAWRCSPLQLAIYCGSMGCAEALLDRGAKIRDDDGEWPISMQIAVGRPSLPLVRLLLAKGADLALGGESLAIAAIRNRVGIARALLDAGADPNGRPDGPRSPLAVAANHSDGRLVELLLQRGATDPHGQALRMAVGCGDERMTRRLLDAGSAIPQRDLNLLREHLNFRGEAARRQDAVLAALVERGYKPGYREIAARRWQWLLGRAAPEGMLRAGCLLWFLAMILLAFGFAFAAMFQAKRFAHRGYENAGTNGTTEAKEAAAKERE